MTTITTKELRDNMAAVVKDLQQGKPMQLSYRRRIVANLQPVDNKEPIARRGSPEAVLGFLKKADFGKIPEKLKDSNRSIKQQIVDLRQADFEKRK